MIGTGVFTSLGFQLVDIQSVPVLLLLWVVGGIIALCGALCYAELGSALPRSGGEYHYVGSLFHPALGFVSGWISATIGFAAPVALVAMTFGIYLQTALPDVSSLWAGVLLVLFASLTHVWSRRASGGVQVVFTSLKVLIILAFIVLAMGQTGSFQPVSITPVAEDGALVFGSAFAISLIYVNYAYTGWNAATYIAGEMADPTRHLPRVLAVGTLTVMLLYVALNAVFLLVAPMHEMVGKVEIGFVAATHIFGERGGELMSLVLAVLLVSTVSAMMLAGPRVLKVIGDDYPVLRFLAPVNRFGVPAAAILIQGGLAILLILSGAFESVLVFTGFTLSLNTFVTVLGVFVLRSKRDPASFPFRMPLWPLPPVLFLILTGWTLVYTLMERPMEGFTGICIVLTGLLLWWLGQRRPRS
jgi:APA family basic amino acid/polyamine antiporter